MPEPQEQKPKRKKIFEPTKGWSEFNQEQIEVLGDIKESIKNGQVLKPNEIDIFAENIAARGSAFGGTKDKEKVKNYLQGMNVVVSREKDFEKTQEILQAIEVQKPTLAEQINKIYDEIGENLDPIELATGDISKIQEQALAHLQNTAEYTKAMQDLKKFKDENGMGFQIEDLLIFPAIFNAIRNRLNGNKEILEAKEEAIKTYSKTNKQQNQILTKLGNSIGFDSSDAASKLIKTKKHLNDMKVQELYSKLSELDENEKENTSTSKRSFIGL